MDKNTLTGMLLMGLVLFGFMYCGRNQEEKQEAQKTEQAAGKKNEETTKAETPDLASRLRTLVDTYGTTQQKGKVLNRGAFNLKTDSTGALSGSVTLNDKEYTIASLLDATTSPLTPETRQQLGANALSLANNMMSNRYFGEFLTGKAQTATLKNNLITVNLSTHGAAISDVTLAKYLTETTSPATNIHLVTPKTYRQEFIIETANQRISTADMYYRLDTTNIAKGQVRMYIPLEGGAEFGFLYTLNPDEYIVQMQIVQKGMDKIIPSSRSSIKFKAHMQMMRNEKGRTFEERNSAIYYKVNDETPNYLSENDADSEDVKGGVKWVAFKNQFFSNVIIPNNTLQNVQLKSTPLKDSQTYLKVMDMTASVDYNVWAPNGPGFDLYFGPNDYPLLSSLDEILDPKEQDLELTRLVPLGWGLFRWINKYLIIPVFNLLGKTGWSYGIIILLLTIFIKIIIFPFTYKSYMSQARMRVLAPEIKEINDKYPGQENAMKRQQETMKLYSRAGASPFSGCLPMLLQMPVLIAMFSFFPSAIELRGQSFLWVHDLSAPDYICTLPFTIPFYGNQVSLFCLLMTVVNILYTRINMQNQPGGNSMPGMKWMMYLMPVMFLFFFNDYAAGLSYYYFLSLLITIVQTYIFRHVVNEDKVRAQMAANAKKPRKKSGFMARLEEAQKRQEAMMRQQAKQNSQRRR